MADDQQNPENGNPQPSGDEGGKLFFGKYKSIEEAENAYKELERGFHAKAQEASQWKELADRSTAAGSDYGQAYRSSYVPYQPPAQAPDPATQELTQFYSDPIGYKKRLASEIKEELTREQRYNQELASRVSSWAERNPDVAKHQALLESYVRRTDGRLNPETRLDLAAQEVRKELAALRGQGQQSNPDPATLDSAPASHREGSPASRPQQPQAPSQGSEEALKEYVAMRTASRVKRPGTHR